MKWIHKISIQEKEIKNFLNKEVENNYKKIKNEKDNIVLNLNKKNEELKAMINNIEINLESKTIKNNINFEGSVLSKGRCPFNSCKGSGPINQFKCPKCSYYEYLNEDAKIICPI